MTTETRRRPTRSIGLKTPERVDGHRDGGSARVRIESADGREGVLRFVLRRVAGGLYVEREELPHRGTRTSVSVEFTDQDGFERWCNDDPCRFEHPLLHQRVRRGARELWELND